MKTVIVVDVPVGEDEIRQVGFLATVHVYPSVASEQHYEFENVVVRPLSQKVEMDLNEYYKGVADGWNDCIDSITGETE